MIFWVICLISMFYHDKTEVSKNIHKLNYINAFIDTNSKQCINLKSNQILAIELKSTDKINFIVFL